METYEIIDSNYSTKNDHQALKLSFKFKKGCYYFYPINNCWAPEISARHQYKVLNLTTDPFKLESDFFSSFWAFLHLLKLFDSKTPCEVIILLRKNLEKPQLTIVETSIQHFRGNVKELGKKVFFYWKD